MDRKTAFTENAPAAVGPYSQAVIANGLVFTAGQTGIVPSTRKLVEGSIKEQTQQTLTNLKAILEAAGSSLDKVCKATVFLKDINDFTAMNEVYATFFTQNPPARSTVQVAKLPLDALVEIDFIALV